VTLYILDVEMPANSWKQFLYHSDLMRNSALNTRAAAEAGIDGEFGLEDFTYNNTSILKVLSHHLSNADFLGITVRQIDRHTQSYIYWIVTNITRPFPIHKNTQKEQRKCFTC